MSISDGMPQSFFMQLKGKGAAYAALAFLATFSLISFVVLMYRGAFYFPLLIDDAFAATVAKNWASGSGFSSSYGELRPFDPEITTGPGILMPLALAIRYLGNEVWVARAVPLTLNFFLFALFLWRIRSWLPKSSWLWFLLVTPLLFSRIAADMWFTPLGDVTAFLYIILAAVLASDALESGHRSLALFSGLMAGLAVLTKTVSLTALSGLLLLPLLYVFLSDSRRTAWCFIFHASFSMTLVLLGWGLYKHIGLSKEPALWQLVRDYESGFIFRTAGSGIAQFLDAWGKGELLSYMKGLLINNVTKKIQGFSYIWLWKYFVYCVLIMSLILGLQAVFSFQNKFSRQLLALFLPASGYLIWFFGFSWSLFDQHFLMGFFLILMVFSLYMARHAYVLFPTLAYLLVAVFLHNYGPSMFSEYGYQKATGNKHENEKFFPEDMIAIGLSNGKKSIFGDVFWPSQGRNFFRLAIEDLIREIETNWPEGKFSACEWSLPYEIEYRLPGNNRLVDCHYLIGVVGDYNSDTSQSAAFADERAYYTALGAFIKGKSHWWPTESSKAEIRWSGTVDFLLVLTPIDRLIGNSQTARLADFCIERVYDNGFYALHRCNRDSLEAYVASEGGIDFYPVQWKEKWLFYQAQHTDFYENQ